jgi:carboxyl-terminal processing protease
MAFSKYQKRGNKQHRKMRWFAVGFISVLIITAVFVSGIQFGRGAWTVNFVFKTTVPANKTLPDRLDYSGVNDVYQALKSKYDGKLDLNALMTGMKKGLVDAAGDPYTTYLDTTEAKDFKEQLNGSFDGIGAELSKQGNNIIVISPISGYPAEKAGLKSKDIIAEIDGQDASGLSVDEAVKRIRGAKGTSVKLTIIRDGQQRLDITIVRDTITIPSVEYKILDDNLGYIKISRFSDDTVGLVDKAAAEFKLKPVKGIILDLRNDPGGYLNTAVSVSNQWLKDGQLILEEKRADKVVQSFSAQGDGQLVGIPTVILINEGSASASEITAGALKDNKAATIIGVTSFGKGSVQEFDSFKGGDVLKVTVARWYTPSGKNIDKEGIEPNFKVILTDEDLKNNNDKQLEAAKSQLLKR